MSKELSFCVDEAAGGMRLDRFVAERLDELSRSQVARLIASGGVMIDGQARKAGYAVRVGQRVSLELPAPVDIELVAEDIPLDVLFEDEEVVVINKPAGLVMHPAQGHASGTLVNALLRHLEQLEPILGTRRPGIVHRLDKDTSGVVVVAKTENAFVSLRQQFSDHSVVRRYLALVLGRPKAPAGSFDTLFGRHPKDRKRFSSRVRRGRTAATAYHVLWEEQSFALLDLGLETGRTHQVRVHLSDHQLPVVGDPVYGKGVPGRLRSQRPDVARAIDAFGRQALHAYRLAFQHPSRHEPVGWRCPPPEDMLQLLELCLGPDLIGEIRHLWAPQP